MSATLLGWSPAAARVADRVYLHPGQMAVAAEPCTLTTILGSCVGVSLHDPVLRVGGLNHFLLPRAGDGVPSPRFGDVAMAQLIREVVNLGGMPRRIEARVFGGACVLDAFRDRASDLGRNNVAAALAALEAAGISVVEQVVAGHRGRRVVFHPHTGDASVREL